MSEELYFFRFNKDISRIRLSSLLRQEGGFSYKQFLADHNSSFGDEVQFDNITRRIDENIEQITEEELGSLFYWFWERYEKSNSEIDYQHFDEKLNEELFRYGLDMFYEIPSKTPVRKFHSLLGDYKYLANKDFHESFDADELRGVLNYIICYTGELNIFLNIHYYKENENCERNQEIQKQIDEINSASDNYFHSLAIAELEQHRAYNIETLNLIPPVIEYRQANLDKPQFSLPEELWEIEERESDLLNIGVMYYIASEIREKLGNYAGKIIRLHFY